jgi:hypothetical protein
MTIDGTQDQDSFAVLPEGHDGAPAKLDTDELQKFKAELNHLARSAGWNINERRAAAEEVRYTLWPGQSPDGRKHADAQDGKPAFPFEGASDARLRLADMIINEDVMVLTAAALRNRPAVTGLELNNAALGHKLGTLLNWVIANKLGADYVRELLRLASYMQSDSPAAAVLGVWWDQEPALEMQTLTLEQIAQMLVQTYGLDPQAVAELEAQLYNPAKDADTAEALQQLVDHLTPKRARQMVRDLRTSGSADYPSPYLRKDQPMVCAYRLMEDIFLPLNTSQPKRARCYFLREWLTETELRTRRVTHRYTQKFIDGALEHEGMTGFPIYRRGPAGDLQPYLVQETTDDRRGLYEVFTVIYTAVNDDDIPAIYYLAFHNEVEEPAHERRLLEYKHGEYPFTWFGREFITQRLMDSRGVPELVATEQYSQKLLTDSFNDHVSLATVPPLKVPANRGKMKIVIGPLKKIEEKRPGEIEFMIPPPYPQANQIAFQQSEKRINEYFGRIAENVPATLTQLHLQHKVTVFLASLTEALTQVLQLCQQFISDEDLSMICGEDGVPIARSREEIQGKFRVELSFDPRHLDMEYLKTLTEVITKLIVPMDTQNTVMRDQLIRELLAAFNPYLASKTLAPAGQAKQAEIEDEKSNLAKIATTIEPPMLPEGQDFQSRLEVMLQNAETNPEYMEKLTPVAAQIYAARLKQLYHQVQQQQNAVTGQAVGQPVFGDPQMMQLDARVKRLLGNGNTSNGGRQN